MVKPIAVAAVQSRSVRAFATFVFILLLAAAPLPSQQPAPAGVSEIVLTLDPGADHGLLARAHAELARDHWKGVSTFEVPYVKWGIKDPSNFLLKVKPVVQVELEMSGEITSTN